MNIKRIFFLGLISIALTLCVLYKSDAQNQEKYKEEFHQTYPLTANGRVSLENINGGVKVEVWDRNEIKVDAVKSADMQEKLQNLEIKIDSSADSIRIKVKYPSWNSYNVKDEDRKRFNNPGSVDFVLTVPRSARIDGIELINGNIDLKDLTGEVKTSSINGKVTAKNLTGDCKLSTINGVLDASFDRVDSGRSITLSSVNGRVEATFPSDVNAQIRASVVHGSLSNNFGLNVRKGNYVGKDMQGVLGNGGARIQVSNVNGSITVNRANDGKQLSNVTNLVSANNSSQKRDEGSQDYNFDFKFSSNDLREIEEEYAEAMRDAQQNFRDAQREIERAQRDLQRAIKELERAKEKADQNPNDEDLKEALRDAREEQKDAERELRDLEKEIRNAQREMEKVQRERARDVQRLNEEIKRAQEAAMSSVNTAKITQEAMNEVQNAMNNVNIAGDGVFYNNLRVVERDSATFNTKGITPRINASTYDGAITIRAWDKDEVSCTVTKRAEDDQQMKGVKFSAEQRGSEIIIKTEFDKAYAKTYKQGITSNAVASLEINVPRSTMLKLNSGDGRIRIEGVNGNIEAKTGDGGVDVRDCSGNINVNTGDGRVYVVNHQGEADVVTGDGNLVLDGRFTNLSAKTGDGSIVLSIPSNTNATIEADAEAVIVDGLPATEESGAGNRLKRWRIGNGGTVFKLHTGDGRISVRKMD